MQTRPSILVFFGTESLAGLQFLDDQLRDRTLEEGIRSLRDQFQELSIITKLPESCAANVQGSEETIRRVKAFLEESQLGTFEDDNDDRPNMQTPFERW